LQAMRTAHAKPCQRTADGLPTGGFTLSKFGARDKVLVAGGGRPELEINTPVNIGNGPYCDNGEGVAATPLPYPLERWNAPENSNVVVAVPASLSFVSEAHDNQTRAYYQSTGECFSLSLGRGLG
jgi:hypothetical protein